MHKAIDQAGEVIADVVEAYIPEFQLWQVVEELR